jgi:hypothetical protein
MATWQQFREHLLRLASRPRERQQQFLFRGQGDSTWKLETTLERFRNFTNDKLRAEFIQNFLDEFRREAVMIHDVASPVPANNALELLGRHHGLPSPFLDWTLSPYISTFFAFQTLPPTPPPSVSVWILDRAKLPATTTGFGDYEIVEDRMLVQFNRRALKQQSVFLRVNTVRQPLQELLGKALVRIDLDFSDRDHALSDLDLMNINSTTLFGDFDGVARTVIARMK